MQIQNLRDTLTARGCQLNPPACEEDLNAVKAVVGEEGPWKELAKLYQSFDGFVEADPVSLVRLWPIKQIMSPLSRSNAMQGQLAFADVQFDAEIAHISLTGDPAITGLAGTQIATSLAEFMQATVEDRVQIA